MLRTGAVDPNVGIGVAGAMGIVSAGRDGAFCTGIGIGAGTGVGPCNRRCRAASMFRSNLPRMFFTWSNDRCEFGLMCRFLRESVLTEVSESRSNDLPEKSSIAGRGARACGLGGLGGRREHDHLK